MYKRETLTDSLWDSLAFRFVIKKSSTFLNCSSKSISRHRRCASCYSKTDDLIVVIVILLLVLSCTHEWFTFMPVLQIFWLTTKLSHFYKLCFSSAVWRKRSCWEAVKKIIQKEHSEKKLYFFLVKKVCLICKCSTM